MSGARPDYLVVGASGLVGGRLLSRFGHAAVGTYNGNRRDGLVRLDITDADACRRVIGELRPRAIVHTAALTHVDLCEREPDRSHAINVDGTHNVARAAAAVGARYVYFSTDYVFGSDDGPHAPDETPDPLNVYGRHKLEAENIVAAALEDHAIVRACNLYGYDANGMNFVMAVWRKLSRGEPVRVPADQWGSPTLAEDLSEATLALVRSDVRGVVHLAGPDYVSRVELARRVARAFDLRGDGIEGVATATLRQDATRPLAGGLDGSDAERRLGVEFHDLEAGLELVVRQVAAAGTDAGR